MRAIKKNGKYINRRHQQIIFRRIAVSLTILISSIILGLSCHSVTTNAETTDSVHYYKYYTSITVENGDTLYSIASDHLTNYSSVDEYIDDVAHINHLLDADITAGMSLIIPYFSTEYK